MIKYYHVLAAVFLFLFCFQVSGALAADTVVDDTCKTDTIINVIVRDADGKFVPNFNFQVYEQVTDVDGNPKPDTSKSVGGGKIDASLGKGTIKFRLAKISDQKTYVVKAWQTNSANSFYFYNKINASCGSTLDSTVTVGSFKVALRDIVGELKKNTAFSIYVQKQDVNGEPVKEKGALVGSFNTGDIGGYTVYLPAEEENIVNGQGGGSYVLEAKNDKGYVFTKYDLSAVSGKAVEIDYVFSLLNLVFKSSNGNYLAKGTKVDLYEQTVNVDHNAALGKSLASLLTDANGSASLEYPPGTYAAAITGADKKQKIYYNLDLGEGKKKTYNLTVDVGDKSCDALGFTLQAEKFSNDPIVGLKYEIYERASGLNGVVIAGALLGGGALGANGISKIQISPNPAKHYILKIYGYSTNVGDFWFYNDLQFVCGQDKKVTKFLPALKIILRKGNGDLLKNQAFSLYAQKIDENGNAINQKTDLVGNFTTNEAGFSEIFVAGQNLNDKNKNGVYALVVANKSKQEYADWGIIINPSEDKVVDYVLSDISLTLQDAANRPLKNTAFNVFKQKWTTDENKKGDAVGTFTTNESGVAIVDAPSGTYVLTTKDSVGADLQVTGIVIAENIRSNVKATVNLTSVAVVDNSGKAVNGASVNIFSLNKISENKYEKVKSLKSIKVSASGKADLILSPGAYSFEVLVDKTTYGKQILITSGAQQNITINTGKDKIDVTQNFSLSGGSVASGPLTEKFKGYILLQVESHGEAWYVDPVLKKRFYLKNGEAAYAAMRKFGLGVKSLDLAKIQVGLDGSFGNDTDGDGLSDKLEESIGTNPNNPDTDGDGYKDGNEVASGYDPLSANPVKKVFDKALSERLKGRILLEVEASGRAWYINPKDDKRYYIKDGDSAYNIMRGFGLGITDVNLDTIPAEILEQ